MTYLNKTICGALVGAAVLVASAINASAAVVCNGAVCWHTREMYEYPPTAGVIVHPDTWRWGPTEKFMWREHEGRGYWSGDRWMEW